MPRQKKQPSKKDKLSDTEQQLRATIHKLKASEQQLRASEQQLKAANQQLDASNQQLRTSEAELRKLSCALQERVKDLECLYGLFRLAEQRDIPLEEIFQGLVELIPPAWQYPEIAAARITFDDRRFKTDNFRKTNWVQSADIKVRGRKAGAIEICYLKKKPVIDEGPFLREERNLLNALAKRLGLISERKRAEEALRETTQTLQAVIQASPLPIFTLDRERIVKTWNPASERTFGWSAQEVIGRKYPAIPEEKMDEADALFSRALKSGLTEVETLRQRKDGSLIDVSISAAPLRDSRGNTNGTMVVLADITERKKAEESLKAAYQQLQASEQQLKAANQQLQATNQQLRASQEEIRALAKFPSEDPNPVLRISKDGTVIYSNDAGLTLLNAWTTEPGKLLPDKWHEFIVDVLKTGSNKNTEFEYNSRILSLTFAPVVDANYVNVYGLDITRRKQAELALKRERDKAETYLDVAAVMMVAIDTEGRVGLINKKGCDVLGYTEDEILGKNWFDHFIPKNCRDNVKKIFNKVLTGEANAQKYYENPILTKDGNQRLIAWHNTLLRDDKGNVIATLSSGVDITERKKAEEELIDYQAQLKSLALQLTLAEESERHRIATELHASIGQSLIISKMKLDELRASTPPGELANSLDEVCELLGQNIQEARTLTFDLSSPILYELGLEKAVAEWLIEQVQNKHGIKTVFIDDGQEKPLDDEIRVFLFRDIRELLFNVIKHAHAKNVKVSISKVMEQIQVTVKDDGWGFEPVKVTDMAVRTGAFGLFSIRQRLELLGGRLEIDSAPGHGTRITITAPLKREK